MSPLPVRLRAARDAAHDARCPTGKLRMRVMRKLPVVPVCRSKLIFVFSETNLTAPPNQRQDPAVPPRQEGRTRRHDREAGCGGRAGLRLTSDAGADGEIVWSWPPDAEAKVASR